MAGGALYGGPFGIVGALANVVMERESGQDLGDTAMAWVTGGPDGGPDGSPNGGESGTVLAEAGSGEATGAASVTTAAEASPATATVIAATVAGQAGSAAGSGAGSGVAAGDGAQEAPATTEFSGRSADRLDAFIRQANAVRRGNPLAQAHRTDSRTADTRAGPAAPGAIDISRMQATALRPPTVERPDEAAKDGEKPGRTVGQTATDAELALAGGDAGSVNQWMLRALDKYEHMQRQETS
jgi:hypothetical protein